MILDTLNNLELYAGLLHKPVAEQSCEVKKIVVKVPVA